MMFLRYKIYRHWINGLIKDSQNGFVCGRVCLTNFILFVEDVSKQVDDNKFDAKN